MAFDRRPLLVKVADKIEVRDFVTERVGSSILSKSYGIMRPGEKIDFSKLPSEFVAKANHCSGGNIIVSSKTDTNSRIPENPSSQGWQTVLVHPVNVDEPALQEMLDYWLSKDYSWEISRQYPEWVYKNIPRGVLFEELLLASDAGPPTDYKFFCFDGKVEVIEVWNLHRFHQMQCSLVTPDWELIDAGYPSIERIEPGPPQPANLSKMLEIAGHLSQGFDFIRVDLYDLGDRIVFGELTHYDTGGTGRFVPRSFDKILGSYWNLRAYS